MNVRGYTTNETKNAPLEKLLLKTFPDINVKFRTVSTRSDLSSFFETASYWVFSSMIIKFDDAWVYLP